MTSRKFRFGVLHRAAPTRAEWQTLARRAEDLGYDTFLISEHFGVHLSMGAALVSAAEATSRLRVGTMVCDIDFRHPALLAKEAASIDVLTEGRFELGLGAGWMLSDYQQTGIPFDPPGVRVERFRETLAILKGLFADGPLTFRGKQFEIEGLEGLPKPKQRPHMPIVIGGGGPRMIELAAREADILSVAMQSLPGGGLDWLNASSAAFDEKLALIRETAGERYASLEVSLLMQKTVITDDRGRAAEQQAGAWQISPEAVLDSPLALIGSADQVVEDLEVRRGRWDASYVCVFAEAMEAFAPVVSRLAGK
ncbi:MAG TPA: TIGR03621 family F420-dependent LLM class oxidoreductase [Chloroflexota bacterium]|nr:TIGR03621 family F420-dependent LLM class oxidoreductase [Chloroflexota bacterium]